MVDPKSDLTFQLILFLPSLFLRCDQRSSALPIERELVKSSINPELRLADAFLSTLSNCHDCLSLSVEERPRIIVEAWVVLLAVRDLGCFIFNWLDMRGRGGPVQKGFTRKYRDALHVNIRNGPTSFALPSQHHELADMTFRAGKKQRSFFHRYMLFRFYER